MTAVLTADSGDVEKISEIISECKRMGIAVLPPDINESFGGFTVVKDDNRDKIRFGLYTIKNFGQGIADAIIEERKRRGKFLSLSDFLERVRDRHLNKKSLESLIMCGAMDKFEERGKMLTHIDRLLAYNKEGQKAPSHQDSLFGLMEDRSSLPALTLPDTPPAEQSEKLRWEKELLGLYISGHPLDRLRDKLEKREVNIRRIKSELREGMSAVAAGLIEESKQVITKQGQKMLFASISDFSGKIEVVVFPRVLAEYRDLFYEENCVAIRGRISNRNGTQSLIAETVKEL
jgi:DNA polymerase-3 subunit alpha